MVSITSTSLMSSLFFNKKHIEHFVDTVLSSNLEFYWNADIRSDLFDDGDLELLAKVKKSGCQSFWLFSGVRKP